MMRVRCVDVAVLLFFMAVQMAVLDAGLNGVIVLMIMMPVIVAVPMLMGQGLMAVGMPVAFGDG